MACNLPSMLQLNEKRNCFKLKIKPNYRYHYNLKENELCDCAKLRDNRRTNAETILLIYNED